MKISEISGFIPLLKERGRSSNQEIQLLKRRLDLRKVGHCGTLDPIADGVLPVLVNRATRTMRFFLEYPKTYLATIKLGISTDSLDITGRVISESVPVVDRMEFIDVIKRYRQEIVQKIPEFSASKFKGKSLYHYARKGIKVPEKVRRVVIYEIEMKRFEPPYIEIEVICSSGTYIRQLI
ncbi:MAG: tRNA pseudouridine(55) synthase TruB, partial [Myxococcota bacterium]